MKHLWIHSFESNIGPIMVGSTVDGLAVVMLPNEQKKYTQSDVQRSFPKYLIELDVQKNSSAKKQILEFLEGGRLKFDLKIDLDCTPFQKEALSEVAKIPFGKTRTYGQIAQKLGKPGASRAVGTANARNPIPLVIPCHRVVASNGLGGFAGGLPLKRKLLALEGALTLDFMENE